jgi:predicted O-methyltransferase YrrM
MIPELEQIFEELEAQWKQQLTGVRAALAEGKIPDRENLLMLVGAETGALLHALVVGSKSTSVLECGTSFGYSTLWLADAARSSGGRVLSLDTSDRKQAHARSLLERVGLEQHVEFIAGDAVDSIRRLDGPFDFVLLDLFQDAYVPALEQFYPKLADSALIVADNMTFPDFARDDAARYRSSVRALPGIEAALLPIGSGLDLARYQRP